MFDILFSRRDSIRWWFRLLEKTKRTLRDSTRVTMISTCLLSKALALTYCINAILNFAGVHMNAPSEFNSNFDLLWSDLNLSLCVSTCWRCPPPPAAPSLRGSALSPGRCGPWQHITRDEASSCVTFAEPRILVWCARLIPQHMGLLVRAAKEAAVLEEESQRNKTESQTKAHMDHSDLQQNQILYHYQNGTC